jgi:hypothetical protein
MVISWGFHGIMIDYNWLVVEPTPLKKYELVSWDYEIPN